MMILHHLPIEVINLICDTPIDPITGPVGKRIEGVELALRWLRENGWKLAPPKED